MSEDQVKVGVYISSEERAKFAIACRILGTTMSDVFREAINSTLVDAAAFGDECKQPEPDAREGVGE